MSATRDDLLRAVAAAFQRRGEPSRSALDLAHDLSLDLAWFTPSEAKLVVRAAMAEGLLQGGEEALAPGFAAAAVTLPLDYRAPKALVEYARRRLEPLAAGERAPAPERLPEPAAPLLDRLVARVAAAAHEDEALVRDRVAVQRRALGDSVSAEVAALLVARSLGAEVGDLLGEAEGALRLR